MKLTLIRDLDSGKSTVGRLFCEDEFLCFTLENTWLENKKRVSCIPTGTYELELKEYGRFYERYQHPIVKLKDVDGRTEILFHKGNYPSDTLGCILVGDSKGKDVIWNSGKTYNKVYPVISNSTEITIVNNGE